MSFSLSSFPLPFLPFSVETQSFRTAEIWTLSVQRYRFKISFFWLRTQAASAYMLRDPSVARRLLQLQAPCLCSRQDGRGKTAGTLSSHFCLCKNKRSQEGLSRLALIFHWPDLNHRVTASCKERRQIIKGNRVWLRPMPLDPFPSWHTWET